MQTMDQPAFQLDTYGFTVVWLIKPRNPKHDKPGWSRETPISAKELIKHGYAEIIHDGRRSVWDKGNNRWTIVDAATFAEEQEADQGPQSVMSIKAPVEPEGGQEPPVVPKKQRGGGGI